MNTLCCGASSVVITPPPELMPNLDGLAGSHFVDVLDDLHVRVIAFSFGENKTLFICYELDKALNPAENIPLISQRTGIPEDAILYTAVHTHTAPVHGERPNEGPNAKRKKSPLVQEATNAYEAFVTERLLAAVDMALSSLRPCRIGWNEGTSYINENRVEDRFVEKEDGSLVRESGLGSNPRGEADPTLFVLRAEDLDGNPIAFFMNYAVHCCIMFKNNHDGHGGVAISADLAGQISTLTEMKFPGSVAIWTSGAAGDINPRMLNQFIFADPMTGKNSEIRRLKSDETAQIMLTLESRRHFQDVLSVVRGIRCDIASAEISSASYRIKTPGAGGPFDESMGSPAPYEVKLRLIRIGDVAFFGVSGELFGSLGRIIKETSPLRSTVVINHDASLAEESGYIFDDDALRRCQREDGTRKGLPDIDCTRIQPGYLADAFLYAVKELFYSLENNDVRGEEGF